MKRHTKKYGVYHWDTFDNETFLVGEADTLAEAQSIVTTRYGGRLRPNGADQVDIVDKHGNIIEKHAVG